MTFSFGSLAGWLSGRFQREHAQALRILDLHDRIAELKAENAMLRAENTRIDKLLDGSRRDVITMSEEVKRLELKICALEKDREILSVDSGELEASAKEARRQAGMALKQLETFKEAVQYLTMRGALTAVEASQLNLGRFIPANADLRLPAMIEFHDAGDLKDATDFGMKSQATEAKFRQLKKHFQTHQAAVSVMLDKLGELGKKNHVTKEDLRKLQEMREALSAAIRRSI